LIHEIRNMGFRLGMLRANLEEHYGDPEFKRSLQDCLASSIEKLDGIVGRYSREEPAVLVKVEVDVNGILREIAGGATRRGSRVSPEESSLLPVLSLSLGSVPEVWGDPYFLRDALRSLIENAIEAARPGGKVLIRTFSTKSGARRRAVVEIIDNGTGMSREFVEQRLFRPFETTKPDGVGLGVFTASQIVRHHRGFIRVQSEAGSGTVVHLSFPGAGPGS
jgi:signal transduction histidine kinase